MDARQSYSHVSVGQAAELAPAALQRAREALAIAERSYQNDPKSFRTRDLAYIADRKAKIAEVLAASAAQIAMTAKANEDFKTAETGNSKSTRPGGRSTEAHALLAKFATVGEDPRGLVIALSDVPLFDADAAVLLPAAQQRLGQIATSLVAVKGRLLIVECRTDIWRPSVRDQQLSQRRADAVRSYIASQGYPGDLIRASGIVEHLPPGEGTTAGDKAGNPRVEIIVEYATR